MSNIIDSIKLSGTVYTLSAQTSGGGNPTVELTQAQYDALVTAGTVSADTYYIITDASGGDLSNYYTKSETSGATQISTALADKLDATAYTPTDLSNYYTKSETSGATEISTALASKADTATTYSKSEVDNAITAATNTKQDQLVSGSNIKTINNESILGSGNITIEGGGGGGTVDPSLDITSPNAVANSAITTAINSKLDTTAYTPTDLSNYYTKSETSGATEISTALSNKQDTLSAGTNITIEGNVISATGGGGGGGKAISAGTNISITTGDTADTINCTLPIREGSNSNGKGIIVGDSECTATGLYGISLGHSSDASGHYSFCNGSNSSASGLMSFAYGNGCNANHDYSIMLGWSNNSTKRFQFSYGEYVNPKNELEFGFGTYNNSSSATTTFGHSGNTLFSIGNGYDFSSTHNHHNAFEVRQNGDIYIPNTDDTGTTGDYAYSLYPMVRLQDTVTATAANTTALGGLSLVKLTQAQYDALATKDNSTLYVIVN